MPGFDRTPTPGRPSPSSATGRTSVPDPRDQDEGVDPPTVRSGSPVGAITGSNGSASRQGVDSNRSDVPPLPVPGERVGDFGLEEAIGAGGMGAVFRAVDIKLDRMVALKILPPDQAIDPEVVQRYYQEGRAAARLDHENIARVFSIGHDGRYHFIAFEYIEGTTIRQRVEAGGPLLVGDAINYTLQIANALVHSSARSVVHRDIKPSNIIVTPQGRAKLVDMGLARRFERGEDTGLTQSGMTLGTFDYISPEQARDPRDVDVRGDLYSLGCTLFHMLSGRPPFPEGTVLQKLLQHQEEPPPEIRKLNPAVPDDLASILVKLMAKDRDRRYQTPEQLVRDLLTVAGSLGLRSLNPEGLVWMAPGSRRAPAWARQLVWGVPAIAFLLILGGMALWGDGPPPPISRDGDTLPPPPLTRPRPPDPLPSTKPRTSIPDAPREYEVYSREDLLRVLAEAPPRSTIVLADQGPYELRAGMSKPLKNPEFTLRAGDGIRPSIRLVRDPDDDDAPVDSALLPFEGGRVTVDGVDFLSIGGDAPAMIRADGTELVVRRCSFRRSGEASSRWKPTAIIVKATSRPSTSTSTERSGSLTVDSSEFDGGQVAVSASGPVEVTLRDCTFGPASADQATVWAENLESGVKAAEIRINHISVLAGAGPVFRIIGATPRIRVDDSAFAPPSLASPSPILVAIDSPDRLDWRGTDNLYGKFAAFLQPLRGSALRGSIRTFENWADDPASTREWGSISVDGSPWEETNPLEAAASATSRPGRAFQLAVPRQAPPRLGARQGPAGSLPLPIILAKAATVGPESTEATAPATPPEAIEGRTRPPAEPARPREMTSTPSPLSPRSKGQAAEPDDSMKAMPLTLPGEKTAKEVDPDAPALANDLTPMPMPMPLPAETERSPASLPSTNPAPLGVPKPGSNASGVPVVESSVIRSAEEFREALSRQGPLARTLVVAAGADLILPACRVRGMSSWVIKAEPGPTRPRLRFRPDVPSSSLPSDSWSAWMTVEASVLKLEGIDIVLPAPEADSIGLLPTTRRRAAFAIAPGTIDLTLNHCTVTIEGDSASNPSAVVALLAGEPGGEGRLLIKDSLIRVGGDLVDVAGGRRLDLEVENAVIATGGTMVHAHGLPEGRSPEELKLVLRLVTARLLGGLAHLQSAPGEPALPVANINARDVVLSTGDPASPLIRVDIQGDLDHLRPLIHWEGRTVAYHLINIYRRNQSSQPGAAPTLYYRNFWDFSKGPLDESSIHGDLKFPYEWPPARRPWSLRRDDLRLPPDSRATGANLPQIPNPTVR